ncbi:hypothetical protein A3C32_02555 [Candidatus Daviesbacteria bacterium RIFCSPHIGHO2_02_FULL_41_14]|uniref:Membrane protein 6-pyruvoyl-tetrahydropterin synthase-related domain-containing protein n=1 Tax=Candidatus Daviesbacteria bacterium RIFCSPLOWO2_01_FULL_40_24 TaxID=1797787 RepID=A0A1F5MIU7_9BACT|nr:MAG: hypothetical protein A2780_03125 [Candidatus Daviesbacteria bacterium RIFCSPHIGHO2_01_FULL_41_45]OGE34977.1 MAG: hypothetical protein A3C32_02555 [Candidatus Daviesbacteria bacterium RIFCSPHIGHO2_02_FULL_41_14]OGE65275.1 MAG: hypothetical protein A3B49_02500 [Candidatus Daviesbacteria bacterium RIFCSPLOWO2_01_FULL_40_24]
MIRREVIVILLLLFLSLPTIQDLLFPGPFTSHDLTHHIVRQIDMNRLLSEGQFPPRWSGELNNGYGYPLFLFNYPLPALVGQLFHLLGLGYIDSVKAILGLSLLGSSVTMYLFLRSLLGNRTAAFLGAIFYLYAPVRFLNVYVSAALGNALALLFVPLVFLSVNKLAKTGKKLWIMGGAISFAALVTSHNVTTVMFAPVIAGFSLVALYLNNPRFMKQILVMFLLGLGLSAWFWLPSLVEKQYIRYDQYMDNFFASRFVPFKDILYSTWGYGSDFSRQVGIAHWLVMVGLVISSTYLLVKGGIKVKEWVTLGTFCLTVFIGAVFLMTEYSRVFWGSVPLLEYVQFPARFLTPAVFAASIAVALLVKHLPFRSILLVGLLGLVLYASRNNMSINQSVEYRDDYYQTLKYTSTAYDEHLPNWARPMMVLSPGKFSVLQGKGVVHIDKNYSSEVKATFITDEETTLQFNQFYFPGWEIKVDDKKVNFDYLLEGESKGFPVFKVPQGMHQIEAVFNKTFIRSLADNISLFSAVIMGVFFSSVIYKKRVLR